VDGAALLGERAALLGLRRRGRVSAGGSARTLPAAEGWLAVNLPRTDDRALLPAWLECAPGDLGWSEIAQRLLERPAVEWEERAQLLGLPVGRVQPPPFPTPPPVRGARRGPRSERRSRSPACVLDLSSLWAGPLCASLLQSAGAQAIKLESLGRPDGGRSGSAAFFDLLNSGKRSAALDFRSAEDRVALQRLIERADIVIEGSRPRALRQLGIDAEAWVDARPGRTWVSISGYGRIPPAEDWVAFGDDAAAAAGLSGALVSPDPVPRFCADAIADPLAGVFAAAAALGTWHSGESRLLDVSLFGAAAAASGDRTKHAARVLRDADGFSVAADGERARVEPPRARRTRGRARALGADTREVLSEC
jgi:crotonobetainyl-CoA:carnitine CoA-transferase CaiB-like acyl-CoA transferase